ncbi:Phosphatidylinositol-glycan biosynthesi clas F protein [Taenia crassiceps]|uniref:Phosphatidylinositol-glycan biosynthesi clas F protein n=1 Tax=Taenia crassiceps TaxID=6207 RepID=A0ABR4Q2N3_9CEST
MYSTSRRNSLVLPIYYFVYTGLAYAAFVLFGAPVLSDQLETLSLSLLFAFLSGAPYLINFQPTVERIGAVLWFPGTKAERFACCSFWGTLVGTWSSAFFLVLDWDRPWQAWPVPCVAGSLFGFIVGFVAFLLFPSKGPPCISLLQQPLDFADQVKIRFDLETWTELFSCPELDLVSICPKEWIEALSECTITDLQEFVVGGSAPAGWPESLKFFAEQCAVLTQELIQSATFTPPTTSAPPNTRSQGVLCLNVPAGHLFYQFHSHEAVGTAPRKVKPKKHHEIEIMSAFLCDFLQNSMLLSNSPLDITSKNDSGRKVTFQTASFEGPHDCGDCLAVNLPIFASMLVDLGSGLGHLPRRVLQRLGVTSPGLLVVAVEADPRLHDTALQMEAKESHPERRLVRLFARVEKDEVCLFRENLLSALEEGWERKEGKCGEIGYVLCGLHCCGDLSEAALKIFHVDPCAHAIVLVGCCYHKMTIQADDIQRAMESEQAFTFPLSSQLRAAFRRCSDAGTTVAEKSLKATVGLRLACQWSPQQWAQWSPCEVYEHRTRVFIRSLLEVHLNSPSSPATNITILKRVARYPVICPLPSNACLASVCQPLPELTNHWHALRSATASVTDEAVGTAVIDIAELTRLANAKAEVWHLLPGLTALQQLVQPLIEALILADRLWSLESAPDVQFATLVRLFDPKLSPRCMALVAVKNNVNTVPPL